MPCRICAWASSLAGLSSAGIGQAIFGSLQTACTLFQCSLTVLPGTVPTAAYCSLGRLETAWGACATRWSSRLVVELPRCISNTGQLMGRNYSVSAPCFGFVVGCLVRVLAAPHSVGVISRIGGHLFHRLGRHLPPHWREPLGQRPVGHKAVRPGPHKASKANRQSPIGSSTRQTNPASRRPASRPRPAAMWPGSATSGKFVKHPFCLPSLIPMARSAPYLCRPVSVWSRCGLGAWTVAEHHRAHHHKDKNREKSQKRSLDHSWSGIEPDVGVEPTTLR